MSRKRLLACRPRWSNRLRGWPPAACPAATARLSSNHRATVCKHDANHTTDRHNQTKKITPSKDQRPSYPSALKDQKKRGDGKKCRRRRCSFNYRSFTVFSRPRTVQSHPCLPDPTPEPKFELVASVTPDEDHTIFILTRILTANRTRDSTSSVPVQCDSTTDTINILSALPESSSEPPIVITREIVC
ncbi:hypothetical protein DM02DRAFT_651548 [Periconia macrospinosa]|uniref:Uncharacterized protein n=1 Tax=Periconia macrospinosa TaxID=97972 RepID=A0A2V1E210_9PLEO|nr:hypothetical protein DM02DRAFT_651548 [Periconia macrospinosa]